jgi:hypothetical protein
MIMKRLILSVLAATVTGSWATPVVAQCGQAPAGYFPISAPGVGAGKVYFYDPAGALAATLNEPSSGASFGAGMAIGRVGSSASNLAAIGSPNYQVNGATFGRVDLYRADASVGQHVATFLPPTAGTSFGLAVAFPGDLNNDGYADFAIGAPYVSPGGRVYIYYGGPFGVDTTADVTLIGTQAGEAFASSLAGGHDLDGDGHKDLVIGSQDYDVPQPSGSLINAGRVQIFRGGTTFPFAGNYTLNGPIAQGTFGYDVAVSGNLNGDSYGDLVVAHHTRTSDLRNTRVPRTSFSEALLIRRHPPRL